MRFSGLEGSQAGLPTVLMAFQHLHTMDRIVSEARKKFYGSVRLTTGK